VSQLRLAVYQNMKKLNSKKETAQNEPVQSTYEVTLASGLNVLEAWVTYKREATSGHASSLEKNTDITQQFFVFLMRPS
jgi:hypothetical protein